MNLYIKNAHVYCSGTKAEWSKVKQLTQLEKSSSTKWKNAFWGVVSEPAATSQLEYACICILKALFIAVHVQLKIRVVFATVYLICSLSLGDQISHHLFCHSSANVSVILGKHTSLQYTNRTGWSLAPLHRHGKLDWVILPMMHLV